MFAWLVVLVGLLTVYETSSQNVDDRLNVVEPNLDLWAIFRKPLKGKPNWKNVIGALYKAQSVEKLSRNAYEISSTSSTTTQPPVTTPEIYHHSEGKIVDSLLDNLDKDKPPVFHSALEGWVF